MVCGDGDGGDSGDGVGVVMVMVVMMVVLVLVVVEGRGLRLVGKPRDKLEAKKQFTAFRNNILSSL